MRIPGGPQSQRRAQIIESIDLYPTLCALAGLEPPGSVEGTSFLPIIQNNAPGKAEALAEWSWSVPVPRINALRTERYRLVYYNHAIGGELYDHESDPGEVDNLWNDPAYAGERMEMVERLYDRVNTYRAASEFRDDELLERQRWWEPTQLMHKLRLDWEVLKQTYSHPVPARKDRPPTS